MTDLLDLLREEDGDDAFGPSTPERRQRAEHAFLLDRGSRFSDDRTMRDPIWLIGELKRHAEIWDDLERETTEPVTYERRKTGKAPRVGRPRMDGHWGLIGCAWLLQRESDVQVFYDAEQSKNLWRVAGFNAVPSYATTVARLGELERFTDGFERATAKLWQKAIAAQPEIGRHVWIDATAYEAHAVPHHDCLDKAACAANGGRQMPAVLERQAIKEVENERHRAQKEPAPEDAEETDSEEDADQVTAARADAGDDLEELAADEAASTSPSHEKYERRRWQRGENDGRELFLPWQGSTFKHRYVIRDADAGCKTYRRPNGKKIRSWVGGLKLTARDVTTGLEIARLYVPADQTEHQNYLELLDRVRRIISRYPENVILDRGYNVLATHRLNEALGIGTVMPWRARNAGRKRHDDRVPGVVDEYGVPYCKFCGSPGKTVGRGLGWEHKNGYGYIRFRCTNPHTADCLTRRQSLRCDEAPRLLGVLSHQSELYWELRLHGKEHERAHRVSRTRYRDGGNNLDTRQKILGIGILEARGAIAGFLEIFRACLRFGWLGNYPKARAAVLRRIEGGKRGLEIFRRLRRQHRLDLPSGPQAEALGLVFGGVLPDGWEPIHERRKQLKNGKPGRLRGKQKAPPPDDLPPDDPDVPF